MDRLSGSLGFVIAAAIAAASTAAGALLWLQWRMPEAAAVILVIALAILVALFVLVVRMLRRELARRAQAERAEDESAAQYRLLADHSSDMIVLINLTDRTRRYVSPSCRQLFGYEPEELIGKSIESMIHPDDLPLLRAGEEEFKRTGRAIITSRNRRKDGRYIWAETTWEKVINSRNGQIELVAVARDATERVEAQQALRAAIDEAQAARIRADSANQAKSQFLANMSHEIRTPINGIMGMSHLLEATPLNEEQRSYAQSLSACGSSLLAIINDILDLSKLEAGGMVLESAPFDAAALVENVVAMLSPLARDKGIALSARIEPTLRGPYLGDTMRLQQALTNLVGNAIKFTERGSVGIEASSLGARGGSAMLRFAVSDTGIGIAAAALPGIFQKFAQADASIARKYGGTGLGLAITKQLVELMGGSIAVESHEGAGSRFWFDLPLPRALSATRAAEEPVAPSGVSGRALSVLLVEDNAVNQRVAQLILGKAGHAVDIVDGGRKAIDAVRASAYDAILMDIQMPDIDGIEATARIRALPPPGGSVPIIALTANALVGARDQYLAAGMNGYVSKPFRPADLLAALDRAVAGSGPGTAAVDQAAPAGPSARTFDPARLDEIRQMTDGASFDAMIGDFARRLEARLARLAQLIEQSAWREAAREAHEVGGIAGAVGAARLSSLARELEAMCQSPKAECRSVMHRIEQEAGDALQKLNAYRSAA